MACNCGKNKTAASRTWNHVGTDGKVIKAYSSEMDARMAASRQPGTTVRPG